MGILQLPRQIATPFTSPGVKPAAPFEIDKSNPIAKRARMLLMLDGDRDARDLVRGVRGTQSGNHVQLPGVHGMAQNFDGSGDNISYANDSFFVPGEMGIFIVADWSGSYNAQSKAIFEKDFTSAVEPFYTFRCIHSRSAAIDQVQAQWNQGGTRRSFDNNTVGFAPTANKTFSYALSIKDGEQLLYAGDLGSTKEQETSSHSGTVTNYNTPIYVGRSQLFSGHQHSGRIYMILVVEGGFTPEEIISLDANPYQVVKPVDLLTYFPPTVVGGDTNVNATTDSLVITEQAATISLDVDISSNAGSLVITEHSATISLDVEISSSTDTLVISGQQADVNLDVTVDAGVGSLVISEHQADVNLDVTVDAGFDTLVITEQNATVSLTSGTNVNATTDNLIITEQAATISLDVNVAAGTDSLVITGNTVTVGLGKSVAANADSLVLTEYAATIDTTTGVLAGVDNLVLTEFPATITAQVAADVLIDGAGSKVLATNFATSTMYYSVRDGNYFTI